MTEGMCFGDKALEGDENTRAATVRASGPLTCARLSAEDCPCPSFFDVLRGLVLTAGWSQTMLASTVWRISRRLRPVLTATAQSPT